MMRLVAPLLLAASLAACEEATPPASAPPAPAPPAELAAQRSLDAMDQRRPVPLLPVMAHHQKENMRDHLAAVEEIVAALASDDFAGVERAAARIGSSPGMSQMCTHMGAGAPGFTEQALGFHRAADRILEAARERNRARVLTELGATLTTCTACHAAWKQQVVDEAGWQKATASAPPQPGARHAP